jgi:hypothetical protein
MRSAADVAIENVLDAEGFHAALVIARHGPTGYCSEPYTDPKDGAVSASLTLSGGNYTMSTWIDDQGSHFVLLSDGAAILIRAGHLA